MNICTITTEYGGTGGIGISVKRINSGLKKQFNIKIVIADIKQNANSNQNTILTKNHIKLLEDITKLNKKYNFKIFHGFRVLPSGFMATYLAKKFNAKSIVSIRGNDIGKDIYSVNNFSHIKWTIENADIITSNAKDLAEICNIYFDSKNKTKIILNSLNPNDFYYKNIPKINTTYPLFGTVGMIREKKGFMWTLKAFKKYLDQINNNASFLVIGDFCPTEKNYYISKIKEYNLEKKIIITGEIRHEYILNYIKLLDVFIMPSLSEGCPNSLLEAMYCKKPIIATNVGAISEIIEHKKNGYIVKQKSSDDIFLGMIEIIKNKELSHQLSENAYKTIIQKHKINTEIDLWAKIYQELLN